MRHIPEEELHAYLDQALSRSQCVEIESHLAECPVCQATRDEIAALRDRTTALLAKLAPRRVAPPSFDVLRSRAAVAGTARHRRVQSGAWAASVVAAIGLGWAAATVFNSGSDRPAPPPAVSRPAVTAAAPAPVVTVPAVRSAVQRTSASDSLRRRSRPPRRPTARLAVAAPQPLLKLPAVELSALDSLRSESDLMLEGVWRTVSWDGARAETGGEAVPHIDGLPVVQVQVQSGEQGKRPLLVVAQQLASGEVIRTIEGPASDVSRLLGRRPMTDPEPADSSSRPTDGPGADHAMAMQRGDRMLAITGKLPSDSLRAMIRRLNAELRSR